MSEVMALNSLSKIIITSMSLIKIIPFDKDYFVDDPPYLSN
ncbi:hypothetical protein DOT_0453 [Desulfosporosinus sp. OT]|nr:hypothetical protein DOT_0453 [Desulfosporosinus sp. OT]